MYSDDVGCSLQVLVLTVGRCHNPAGGNLAVLLFNIRFLEGNFFFTVPYVASRLKVQSLLIYCSMGYSISGKKWRGGGTKSLLVVCLSVTNRLITLKDSFRKLGTKIRHHQALCKLSWKMPDE